MLSPIRNTLLGASQRPVVLVASCISLLLVLFATVLMAMVMGQSRMSLWMKVPLLVGSLLLIWPFSGLVREMYSFALFRGGMRAEKEERWEEAETAYEKAWKLKPDCNYLAVRLLVVYEQLNRIQKGRVHVEELEGRLFDRSEMLEMEALVARHREVRFEEEEGQYRLESS